MCLHSRHIREVEGGIDETRKYILSLRYNEKNAQSIFTHFVWTRFCFRVFFLTIFAVLNGPVSLICAATGFISLHQTCEKSSPRANHGTGQDFMWPSPSVIKCIVYGPNNSSFIQTGSNPTETMFYDTFSNIYKDNCELQQAQCWKTNE